MEGSIKFANVWEEMFKIHAAKPVDYLQANAHFNCFTKGP